MLQIVAGNHSIVGVWPLHNLDGKLIWRNQHIFLRIVAGGGFLFVIANVKSCIAKIRTRCSRNHWGAVAASHIEDFGGLGDGVYESHLSPRMKQTMDTTSQLLQRRPAHFDMTPVKENVVPIIG